MNSNRTALVILNYPCPFLDSDQAKLLLSEPKNQKVNWLVNYLTSYFEMPIDVISKEMLDRHREIITSDRFYSVITSHEKIASRITNNIKDAGRNYCLEKYTASIALSGLAAEMLAIFRWKKAQSAKEVQILSEADEINAFGQSFEKLDHRIRVEKLKEFNLIDAAVKQFFDHIRDKRRDYLHYWTYEDEKLPGDAASCYRACFGILKKVIDVGLADSSSIKADSDLLDWIEQNPEKEIQ